MGRYPKKGLEERNIAIVERFYDLYERAPRRDEFIQCGGSVAQAYKAGSYQQWLRNNKYETPRYSETYEVYDEEGKLIFTGTSEIVAEEYYYAPRYVRRMAAAGKRTKSKLLFKHKPFDEKEWEIWLKQQKEL